MRTPGGSNSGDRISVAGSGDPAANPGSSPHMRVVVVVAILAAAWVVFAATDRQPTGRGDPPQNDAAAELDLLTSAQPSFIDAWIPGGINGDVEVSTIARLGEHLVAVGSANDRAGVWTSRFGDRWDGVTLTGRAQPEGSSITSVVRWEGHTYGYGPYGSGLGVWRAQSYDEWEYVATVLSGEAVVDVAAAGNLLAVTTEAGGAMAIYTSGDGVDWSMVNPHGLDAASRIQTLASFDGWFYAAGSDCADGVCRPSLHRSETGITWETVTLPTLSAGVINDIVTTGRGLIAVGTVEAGDGASQALILGSDDAGRWHDIDGGDSFAQARVTVAVLAADLEKDTATLLIDGESHEIAEGASVVTDAGRFSVGRIAADQATLVLPTGTRPVAVGETAMLVAGAALQEVTASGDRIVVTGHRPSRGAPATTGVAGVWSSADGGDNWVRVVPDDGRWGGAVIAYSSGSSIVLTAPAANEAATWASAWRTRAADELDYAEPGA